ncbi:hypothetical protein RCL_jg13364.t1 [Rhizophagus clarus]|uniref:Uncharacterized protein n=1 Tax=Rhizophagus clarus TaxID=94130 RepID=A0A8H3QRI7_9GLOM|nr:hypothetical protein RCL_jg13364.t1 [Rhizophagus clarus]
MLALTVRKRNQPTPMVMPCYFKKDKTFTQAINFTVYSLAGASVRQTTFYHRQQTMHFTLLVEDFALTYSRQYSQSSSVNETSPPNYFEQKILKVPLESASAQRTVLTEQTIQTSAHTTQHPTTGHHRTTTLKLV